RCFSNVPEEISIEGMVCRADSSKSSTTRWYPAMKGIIAAFLRPSHRPIPDQLYAHAMQVLASERSITRVLQASAVPTGAPRDLPLCSAYISCLAHKEGKVQSFRVLSFLWPSGICIPRSHAEDHIRQLPLATLAGSKVPS